MSNLSAIRAEIKTALKNANVPATIYSYPPKALPVPSVSIVPGSPYIEPINLGTNKFRTRYQITAAVNALENEAAIQNLEELLLGIYAAIPAGWIVSNASSPRIIDLGQSVVLSADVTLEIIATIGD